MVIKHIHAHALEVLKEKIKTGSKVLDVGSGSGYLTACFSVMVGETGKVIGIDHIDELVKNSMSNLRKWKHDIFNNGNVELKGTTVNF